MFVLNTHGFAPFKKVVFDPRRAATLFCAYHQRGTCTRTLPFSGVTRQAAHGCA
jgi:hypothetical protein